MILNREKLAWAAGFFDGEGTTHTSDHQRPYGIHRHIRLTVSQAGTLDEWPQVLEMFIHAVQVGTIYGPYEKQINQRPLWTYSVHTFEEVQFVVCLLWPWLGDIKKEQAAKALKLSVEFNLIPNARGKRYRVRTRTNRLLK